MEKYKVSYEAFSKKHIETYYSWRNDVEINIFDQPGFNSPIAFEIVEEWCDKVINQKDGYTFFLKDEVANVYIGICALMHIDYKNRNCELSIVIGNRDYWGKGVGTEVMNQLIEWGFNSLNLHKLYLHVFSSNTRAISLYEKLGFKKEGVFEEELFRNGEYQSIIRYGLLKGNAKK
jgi:Acetyltransferases, including N-acetylases of ribosomal proteins